MSDRDDLGATSSGVARREKIEGRLGSLEARYRTLVEQGPAVSYIVAADETSSAIYVSPQIHSILGYAPDEWLTDPELFVKLLHPEDRESVLSQNERTNRSGEAFRLEYRLISRNGRTVWVLDEAVAVCDESNRPIYWQGIMIDVTERKDLESRLVHLAYHDVLTGLSNRTLFREHLESALGRVTRRGEHLAVLYLDLDGFKRVNDTWGHEVGDGLLVAVSKRLESSLRNGDTAIARLGGDEFCVLLEGVAGKDAAVGVSERIRESLGTTFRINDHRISFVSTSIGIAMKTPTESKSPEQLLREADASMYRAKEKGKDRCEVFETGMVPRALRGAAQLEDDLRQAIEKAGLSLHYQPKVSLATGEIVGWEALARWELPDGSSVAPTEFVPLAEEIGMILPFGRWVLKEACLQAQEWQEKYPGLTMNVNFSVRQLHYAGLAKEVADVLAETGLDPGRLCIEITESAAIEDAETAIMVLQELKELGVSLAIDDFGVGYSSLSYLKRFPVDILKIDRSIIEGLERDPGNAAIVSATITLAHVLGLEVVAEGVETEAEAAELRALGCDFGQGFYWWMPRPADAAAALLESTVS